MKTQGRRLRRPLQAEVRSTAASGRDLTASYLDSYEINGEEVAGTNGAWPDRNISAIPRWKGLWSFDWEQGPWVRQLTINYIHSYWRTYGYNWRRQLLPAEAPPAMPQNGTLDRSRRRTHVRPLWPLQWSRPTSGQRVDRQYRGQGTDLGTRSFTTTYFYDRQAGYDIRGRTIRVGVDYKFK